MKFLLIALLMVCQLVIAKDNIFIIKKGDNLTQYFYQLGLSNSLLINLINSSNIAKKLNNLNPGRVIIISTKDNKFTSIYYEHNKKNALAINLIGTRFYYQELYIKNNNIVNNMRQKVISINSNLSADAVRAGLTNKQTLQLSKALTQKVNLKYLQKDDKIKIYLINNEIKAVKFNQNKKSYKLYKWKNLFYDEDGITVNNIFLSSPLRYKRISSGFTYSRYHPILKINRPHRAIDYAANYGTKVWATNDGIISFRGFREALGNVIIIKHRYNYETVYAHLSKFKKGLYKNKKVKKGEVIGFVGSTGRSTGNHLHYELKSDEKYFNPLTHKPKAIFKLKNYELISFKKYIKQYE